MATDFQLLCFVENQSRERDQLKMKEQNKELEVIQAKVDFLQKELHTF